MFGKDLMKNLTDAFNQLSDEEKEKRRVSMKNLLEEELKRRNKQKPKK